MHAWTATVEWKSIRNGETLAQLPEGLAPFLRPLPLSLSESSPALYVAQPFFWICGALRFALLVLVLALKLIFGDALLLLSFAPGIQRPISLAINGSLCRLALGVMGYYWITLDSDKSISTARRSLGRAPNANRTPQKGDLIISNWTSYIEILFLVFKHDPIFYLPVITADHKVIGVQKAGAFKLAMRTGCLPIRAVEGKKYLTLAEAVESETRPICVFPELTTSNNRAVLPFFDLGSLPTSTTTWIYSFRHEVPSTLKSTAVLPIPYPLNPLPHLYLLLCNPFLPREVAVKRLNPNEAPNPGKSGYWKDCEESCAALNRLKVVKVSAREKESFLQYWAEGGKTRVKRK